MIMFLLIGLCIWIGNLALIDDAVNNRISFELTSFSEIQLGVFAAVPEPSSLALGTLLIAAVGFRRQRREDGGR
jgi:hypothetical protein